MREDFPVKGEGYLITEIDEINRHLLDLLQKKFPLTSRPFAILGQKLCISEEETLQRVENLYKKGIIRQISAIFDARRLGYDSCLVAMHIPPERLDSAAAVINEHPGVSHNYSRSHLFNLWFTIVTPPQHDLTSHVRELSGRVDPKAILLLPSIRMFKIGLKLNVTGAADPLSKESGRNFKKQSLNDPSLPALTEKEIAAIRELQENLPVEIKPFNGMADRLGMTVAELFVVSRQLIRQGRMRRFAAVLRHREVGFKVNAMGVWVVPRAEIERVGTKLAAFQVVSHCYERPAHPPVWPYNIFTMIHAHTREECLNIFKAMSEETGISQYDYLFSEKEYKKRRVRYFVE